MEEHGSQQSPSVAEQAAKLKAQANQLPARAEREAFCFAARIAETGAHLSDWLTPPCGRHAKPVGR
jgi:hypothetical protein